MKNLHLAFSPCPNDTFIFHALLHGFVPNQQFNFQVELKDVEELNESAMKKKYDISKMSFYAYLFTEKEYTLLDSGAAIGFGCGPLLVAKDYIKDLKNAKIAIPGKYTTAYLLLQLWQSDLKNIVITKFDTIMDGIVNGEYDAGLIIHEGRFVYEQYKLKKIIDLGEWWEQMTGLPIPLGCIAIRNEMLEYKSDIERMIHTSITYGFNNKSVSRNYIKKYSQELDDMVIDSHIDLYVNDFSMHLQDTGLQAIERLRELAFCKNIIK